MTDVLSPSDTGEIRTDQTVVIDPALTQNLAPYVDFPPALRRSDVEVLPVSDLATTSVMPGPVPPRFHTGIAEVDGDIDVALQDPPVGTPLLPRQPKPGKTLMDERPAEYPMVPQRAKSRPGRGRHAAAEPPWWTRVPRWTYLLIGAGSTVAVEMAILGGTIAAGVRWW